MEVFGLDWRNNPHEVTAPQEKMHIHRRRPLRHAPGIPPAGGADRLGQGGAALFGCVLGKAGEYGAVTVRRAYGDCGKLSDWDECLRHHGIRAVPNYADGRNAADATLIIDAMDLLNSGTVDGFCIVASDHLFAGLVRRLRRKGTFVAGIGRRDAPAVLRKALCMFTAIEDLDPLTDRSYGKGERVLIDRIKAAVGRPGEYVPLSELGKLLTDVDYRAYCHGDLTSLVGSYPEFVVRDGASIKRPPGTYVGLA